jgi:CheY-like chemotaxis protein
VLSHELRSPLNPILGWSKLLQTGRLDEVATKQALSVIERNARLQSELIEDLLDISRILRGKLSLNYQPVNLAAIIQAAMETVRLAAEAKSIDMQFTALAANEDNTESGATSATQVQRIEPTAHGEVGTLYVMGDPTRLQQVIWNLLSNAIKFTAAGGRVTVVLQQVADETPQELESDNPEHSSRLPVSTTLQYAQLTVCDTGKGIPPDFLPYVFDHFRQADSATTRKFGGLGLGLAIVRHLVELHGGTVQADSPGEGLGATFTVRLPLLRSDKEGAAGWQEQSYLSLAKEHPLSGVRVLVVDDDTDALELLTFLLEQSGATVTAVSSAEAALAALSQSPPNVILSDIGMPDTDGYMLIRQIRALPEQGGRVPAIALTAYAGDFNRQQAMQAGFQRHLTKPIDPDTLISAIVHLVQPRSKM